MHKNNNFGLKAAASAAARIDSMLLAKGKIRHEGPKIGLLPTPGKLNEIFSTELEINDTPVSARNLLTKGQTQDEISLLSGAAISTRGRYMNQLERSQNSTDRALYLFIQGPNSQSLDIAIQKIDEIIRSEQATVIQRSARHKQPQPPPLMSIQTNLTSVDKVMIGLDHAPLPFDLRGRLIGQGGANLEYIRNETGAVVTLRGRGSLFIDSTLGTESPEPMHLFIEHPRYDGLVAARQLALNLIETMQQELAQFQQMNPPTVANIQAVNQAPQFQNVIQQPQQVFTHIHQPIAIPPPMLAVPPPVQIPQIQQHGNILSQPGIVHPTLNIIQPSLQPNMIQTQGTIQQSQPMLMQQPNHTGVVHNNNLLVQQPPPQLNLPPPGVHIPSQQGPMVPSSSQQQQQQQQQIILSQPPPTLTLPPPALPPPNNNQLIIVSSAQSHFTQQPQMFVSQPANSLNHQPYQYHIIHGANPIYTTSQHANNVTANNIAVSQLNDGKHNGPQFQTMTVQQVYQPQTINSQGVLPHQEQYLTQPLNGQQFIVTPNSAPIYIVPPPNQSIQTQPSPQIDQNAPQTQTILSTVQHIQHHPLPGVQNNVETPQPPPPTQITTGDLHRNKTTSSSASSPKSSPNDVGNKEIVTTMPPETEAAPANTSSASPALYTQQVEAKPGTPNTMQVTFTTSQQIPQQFTQNVQHFTTEQLAPPPPQFQQTNQQFVHNHPQMLPSTSQNFSGAPLNQQFTNPVQQFTSTTNWPQQNTGQINQAQMINPPPQNWQGQQSINFATPGVQFTHGLTEFQTNQFNPSVQQFASNGQPGQFQQTTEFVNVAPAQFNQNPQQMVPAPAPAPTPVPLPQNNFGYSYNNGEVVQPPMPVNTPPPRPGQKRRLSDSDNWRNKQVAGTGAGSGVLLRCPVAPPGRHLQNPHSQGPPQGPKGELQPGPMEIPTSGDNGGPHGTTSPHHVLQSASPVPESRVEQRIHFDPRGFNGGFGARRPPPPPPPPRYLNW